MIGNGVAVGAEVGPLEGGGELSHAGERRLVLRAGREESLIYVVLASPSVVFTSMGKWLGRTAWDVDKYLGWESNTLLPLCNTSSLQMQLSKF